MIYKRAIPKVTMAALTLGSASAAAMGCSGDAVRAWCEKRADCLGYTSEYADECVQGWNEAMSYYDSRCERAARRAMSCQADLTCRQLDDGMTVREACGEELDAWDACW